MSKMIKTIVIDPFTRTIEHGTLPYGNDGAYTGIVDAVFEGRPAKGYIELVRVDRRNAVWVDEEGLLKDWADQRFFTWGPQQLAGRGVITGVNEEGDTVDATIDIERVRRDVKFVGAEEVSIPAPTLTTFDGDGKPTVEPLHGSFEPWTVDNPPPRRSDNNPERRAEDGYAGA